MKDWQGDKMKEELLDEAIEEALVGVEKKDGGPFGAIIVDKNGNIISKGHNAVLTSHDPTLHAEVMAIREACRKLGTHDLSGYTIYSSCEPCPMCLSAIIWSNINTLYYGATRKDAAKIGFRDDIIYEYLANKNNILEKQEINSLKCKELLDNYEGEMY